MNWTQIQIWFIPLICSRFVQLYSRVIFASEKDLVILKKTSNCIIFSFGISKIGTVALNHATIAIIIIVRIISHLSYNLCQNILKVCVIFENRCWKFTLIKRVKTNEATANNGANQIRIVFSSSNFKLKCQNSGLPISLLMPQA